MSYFNYKGQNLFYEETGNGQPLLMLHGNTASSKMFAQVVPILARKHHVITMDFLGCGQSDRLKNWPFDLWYAWAEQAAALCKHLSLQNVNVIGCSGGALAAINFALEHPKLVNAVIADSFEGVKANISATEQIRLGRNYGKQNADFCSMLKLMHGADWEDVLNADTNAVVHHAQQIVHFFHKPLTALSSKLLLTGSAEDEMFPKCHYDKLFSSICLCVPSATMHIFAHGGHPSMMSNAAEFIPLCESFLLN